jgi:predicted ATPase/class 3 adenylate cyclase
MRPPELPEGVVTFLLTDIEGSTPLWETHAAAMSVALARHEALVTEVVASCGGRLIKSRGEGDSTLSVFVRATDAVAAALALQQVLAGELWPEGIALPTRAALHSGEAELRAGDYYGQTLNRAARLRALAEGGHVLISQGTAELVADQLPAGTSLADVGKHHLKGLSRQEHVFALVHPDLGPPPQLRSAPAASAGGVFVGRDAELAQLDTALDAALGGQGRLVLVAGEPGIGKTRLAQELGSRARERGGRLLWGRCYEGDGAPAYWPWVQVLRAYAAERGASDLAAELGKGASVVAQLLPEVADALGDPPAPPVLEPELARFRLFDAVSAFLRGASRAAALVVVVDDLHWADQSSLLLLQFLTRELGAARVLLIGTYRDVEVTRRHPLSDTLAELVREPVTTRLVLGGLGQTEVARCIFDVSRAEPAADLVAAVHDRTEGNPFFITEVVRMLAAEGRLDDHQRLTAAIPDGIQQVIGRRLNRFSDATNELLAVASVQGRDFDLDVLCHVAGVSAGEALGSIEDAVDAHLVAATGRQPSRHRFVHALVRETVYEELPIGRRRSLHHQTGEALVALRASDLDAHLAELAHHFFQAALPGQAAPAVEYCTRAADRAFAVLAYHEAIGHYQRALHALNLESPSEHARRAELLLAMGRAQAAAAGPSAARETYEQAAASARRVQAAESLAQAALGLGVEFVAGLVDDLEVRLLEEALATLPPADSTTRARVLARLAKALQFTPFFDRRAQLSDEAVHMARRLSDPATLAAVLYDRHVAIWGAANAEERLAIAREVLDLAERSDDQALALQGHALQAGNLLELGDMAALNAAIQNYDHLARDLRQLRYLWLTPFLRATQATVGARFEQAEQLAQEGLALGQQAQHPGLPAAFGITMATIRFAQGRLGELADVFEATVEGSPTVPAWRTTLAAALCQADRVDDARGQFERLAVDDFTDLPRDFTWMSGLATLAWVCAWLNDRERAPVLYDLLLPFAPYNGRVSRFGLGCIGPVAYYLGLLASTMSRWADAIRHLEAAMDLSARIGGPAFLANSRLQYAHVLRSHGQRVEDKAPEDHLAQAHASASILGIRLHMDD